MDSELEPGRIDWGDFQSILSDTIKSSYEAVVAELIDNSIDANASKIFVEYYGSKWEEFATIVFDNGDEL